MDPVVREVPKAHECVCLLIKGPAPDPRAMAAVEKAAEAAGIPQEVVKDMLGVKDKCHRMVGNPDQPFCDECERADHHTLPNQLGMRNIVKENRNDPATEC